MLRNDFYLFFWDFCVKRLVGKEKNDYFLGVSDFEY